MTFDFADIANDSERTMAKVALSRRELGGWKDLVILVDIIEMISTRSPVSFLSFFFFLSPRQSVLFCICVYVLVLSALMSWRWFLSAPPRWLREPSDVSALLGSQAVLSCPVAGYPAPKVTWSRITGEQTQTQRLKHNSNKLYKKITLYDTLTLLLENHKE